MSTDHDLLGAYCTDALDPAERAEFEAHLATCGTCRAEAAEFREVLAALAEAHPVRPPADLEDRVVAGVRAEAGSTGSTASAGPTGPVGDTGSPTAGAGSAVAAPPRRGWTRAATWLAAAAAGAVLFTAGVGVGRAQAPESLTATAGQASDALAVASAADAHVMDVDIMGTTSRLVVSDEMDKSVFLASELPTPAKGMCYQVWRVTADGQMVSAGAFTPGADGHIVAVLDGGGQDVAKFMITMEPPGGSDHPTGEMLGEIDA